MVFELLISKYKIEKCFLERGHRSSFLTVWWVYPFREAEAEVLDYLPKGLIVSKYF
jgi:hypothetical protein